MKVKVPVAFPIGDRWIKVKYYMSLAGKDEVDVYGETLVDDLLIKISKTANKNEQDIFDTLYHELKHVAFQMTGHAQTMKEEQEEALAYALQYTLARLFVFNPKAGIKFRAIDFPWDED
jgi:hypothetical protein